MPTFYFQLRKKQNTKRQNTSYLFSAETERERYKKDLDIYRQVCIKNPLDRRR